MKKLIIGQVNFQIISFLCKLMYFVLNSNNLVVAQVVAVVASLVSLSWSLVSYHRALRISLPDKVNMSWQVWKSSSKYGIAFPCELELYCTFNDLNLELRLLN
jgi:hypothetical protein